MSTMLINGTFASYLLAVCLNGARCTSKRAWLKSASVWTILFSLVLNTLALGFRWVESGHAPFSNMYESLILLAWSVAVVYLLIEAAYHPPYIGLLATLLAVIALAAASFLDPQAKPLIPALQSNWLIFHVFFCMVSYSALALSFAAAILFLLVKRFGKSESLPAAMDRISYQSLSFGYLFLAVGIVTGAVWADQAWGTYWSWDPKETWALITWLIYGIYLHCKLLGNWTPVKLAWLSIGGFVAVIFTYVGVSYLLPGLHSYA